MCHMCNLLKRTGINGCDGLTDLFDAPVDLDAEVQSSPAFATIQKALKEEKITKEEFEELRAHTKKILRQTLVATLLLDIESPAESLVTLLADMKEVAAVLILSSAEPPAGSTHIN